LSTSLSVSWFLFYHQGRGGFYDLGHKRPKFKALGPSAGDGVMPSPGLPGGIGSISTCALHPPGKGVWCAPPEARAT
jgi:hypothetical protein